MSFGTHAEHGNAEYRQEQYNATLRGAAKGSLFGLAVATPTAYMLQRSWAPFRALNLPVKSFFVMSATVMTGVICADKAGIAFNKEHYSDQGAKNMKRYATHAEREWDQLSTADKALTWTKENKVGIVAGSWVASMAGTFAFIQTQPLSFAQKLVQARVWAQGLTLASLVGMAAITQIPSAGDRIIESHLHAKEHSWKDYIPQEMGEELGTNKDASSKSSNRSSANANTETE
ncbi:hypothetical protein K437DRAFT_259359 [Tilletiaria anomala UBC 951]|uniref:HIG1 domain-containing protein n=1 Tax=Tilletiaria anomala (strain ATCC 24038 / CBS 436.72 / UBC 951) TaxID=1037660 RepID=A0A066VAR2_TILAU|nr:uncharacterized protein K437DRAFT_259359 [Tilletiaria anomala UBC 951]KDN38571.1 hypothetical protein K437DRAFT_259359 [Tilletiaria anomala UBC 951]